MYFFLPQRYFQLTLIMGKIHALQNKYIFEKLTALVYNGP